MSGKMPFGALRYAVAFMEEQVEKSSKHDAEKRQIMRAAMLIKEFIDNNESMAVTAPAAFRRRCAD